jgi:hypothetical protein
VDKVPETPPSINKNDEPEMIEKISTSFYTPAELESYGMTPKQEEIFDQ